jgi:hypothetical protein
MGKPILFRRKFLIEKELQLSIIFYLVGLFVVSVLILYFGLRETYSVVDAEILRIYPKEALALKENQDVHVLLLQRFFFYYLLATIPLFALGALFLSHRVAGPIYRIRMILKQMLAGQKPFPMQVRKNDFMKDIIALLKEVVEKNNLG